MDHYFLDIQYVCICILFFITTFRSLLENYPGFFSFGAVSKQGVPKQKVQNNKIASFILYVLLLTQFI